MKIMENGEFCFRAGPVRGIMDQVQFFRKSWGSVTLTAQDGENEALKTFMQEGIYLYKTFQEVNTGRFPFNPKKVRFEFLATSNSEWYNIFRNF